MCHGKVVFLYIAFWAWKQVIKSISKDFERKKMDFGLFINPLRAMSFWKNGFFKEEKNETYAIFKMS